MPIFIVRSFVHRPISEVPAKLVFPVLARSPVVTAIGSPALVVLYVRQNRYSRQPCRPVIAHLFRRRHVRVVSRKGPSITRVVGTLPAVIDARLGSKI
jgi:hypothetical protein